MMDGKSVFVVSNIHRTGASKVARRLKDGIKKCFAVERIHMFMGAVDRIS